MNKYITTHFNAGRGRAEVLFKLKENSYFANTNVYERFNSWKISEDLEDIIYIKNKDIFERDFELVKTEDGIYYKLKHPVRSYLIDIYFLKNDRVFEFESDEDALLYCELTT